MSDGPGAGLTPEEIHRRCGYELDFHRIMTAADPEWVRQYAAFVEATYTGPRLLDRKKKELLQIVVEAALRADADQIRARAGRGPRPFLRSR